MNPFAYRLQTELALLDASVGIAMATTEPPANAAEHPVLGRMRKSLRPTANVLAGGLAVLPIHGVLARKPDPIEMAWFGVEASELVTQMIDEAAGDDSIEGALLDIDSPGGMVVGGLDISAAVERLQSQKPVVAFSGGRAASLGYHLAAPAGTIIGAQSSEWGSIGAVISYLDVTKALEMRGLKPITITSKEADLKAVGSAVELTDEKRAYLQARVDKLGADFRAHVKRFRGDVAEETKRGGMFYAPAARDAGLIDAVGSFDYALATLRNQVKQRR